MKSKLQSTTGNSRLVNLVRDLCILVVGILVALWAEGQWQERQETALVRQALAQIARGLEKDITDMSGNLTRARDGYEAATWFQGSQHDESGNTEDLRSVLRNLGTCSFADFDFSAYVMLKNSGNLGLIENKELQQRITSIYEGRPYLEFLHETDCGNSRGVFALLAPHIKTTIDSNFDSLIPLIEDVPNPQAIYDDQVLLNHIMALGLFRKSAISNIEYALNETKKLREEILVEMAD